MANDMPDLTLEVLKDIRADLREMKTELHTFKQEIGHKLDVLTHGVSQKLESLADAIVTGFVENEHGHADLETRVARIEAHLNLGR